MLSRRVGGSGLPAALRPTTTAAHIADTPVVLDAGTAFSAWWSGTGPEKPALGIVQGGRGGA
jgi:hypothetical protein